MHKGLKILTALTVVAGSAALGGGLLANCQNEGPYAIVQCGTRNWFAPPPAGSGPISAAWWQLGFGNRNLTHVDPASSAATGNGFQAGVGFIGNDSGTLPVEDPAGNPSLDLVDAQFIGGPAGGRCFSSGSNWAPPGVDGCADNARTGLTANGYSKNDGFLNKYYGPYYGVGTETLNYQLDAPMGVLLTEGSGNHFAIAMFASEPRPARENDQDPGVGFNMREIVNGEPNPVVPGQNNIVPWQPIPQPFIGAVLSNPADPGSDRILTMNWPAITIHSDNSNRPSTDTTLGPGVNGVGVTNQGQPLFRHVVETAPIVDTQTGACGTFAAFPGTEGQGTTANITVPAQTCVRLVTHFGRKPDPTATTVTGPIAAVARLGDLGYNVVSRTTLVGGPLVSENAQITVAQRSKGHVLVQWTTSTELTITGFDIVGKDGRGEKVLAHKACAQCNNGLGASYEELIPAGSLKGAKSVVVVMQPSGARSNEVPIQ